MNLLKRNIISNIVGKGFSAFLALLFVPFYIELLGSESYGLIGFFVSLQTILSISDMGLNGAFIRQTAKLSIQPNRTGELRDLCRTFEVIFFVLGCFLALIVFLFSEYIAFKWLNPVNLSPLDIKNSVILMGGAIGAQFVFTVYQGALNGLQRQVVLNGLLVLSGVVRGVGAILLLTFVEARIDIFFMWQVAVSVIQLLVVRVIVWRGMPYNKNPPQVNFLLIKPLFKFALGMSGITITSVILMQVDKVILSRMISLESFGYYSLAVMAASIPMLISSPVNNAIYPRLTQLVAGGDWNELRALYHRSCKLVGVLIIPIGLVVASFSRELIFLWTQNEIVAENSHLLLSVLVIGSTMLGLMAIPYSLQLAFAWTKLAFFMNIIAIIILVPLLIQLTSMYGALGASFVWVILNFMYVFITIQIMHRRVLQDDMWEWYLKDVGKPLLASSVIVLTSRYLVSDALSDWQLVLSITAVFSISVCAAGFGAFGVRNSISRVKNIVVR
jgi:O-antigen/teichoic acid export membrane protein